MCKTFIIDYQVKTIMTGILVMAKSINIDVQCRVTKLREFISQEEIAIKILQ